MKIGGRWLAIIGLLVIGVVTAFAATVKTDYDHSVDFTKYRTYMWIDEPKTENPLMKDRIIAFINVEMNLKGAVLVQKDGALGIAAHAATKEERSLQVFYNGQPGWWWRGFPNSVTQVDTYEVGTLVVDMFDSATHQIIWRGTASDTISDNADKNTKQLQKAIQQMFKQCPLRPRITN